MVSLDYAAEATITIDQIVGDDIINAHESQQPTTSVTGTVGGDARVHDVVTLTVNGHEFTGTVQPMPNGHLGYSIDVNTADLANGQQVHATITTTDGAGNTATATADHVVSLDYVATADITIDQIAGDDVINAHESQQPTTSVTGTVGGDARVHDVVTLTVNGHDFTGTVQPMPNGHLGYSIDVNTADLANGQQVHATITTTDGAGNTATATADHVVSLDYVATADITIDQIAGDDIINAHESQQPTTSVTGTVGGDARVHDVVTLTVNGHEFTGTVQPMPNGHLGYSIDVNTADLANGQQVHASITATDGAGNTIEATADHTVTPDYAAEATITINQIAGDDVINAQESQQPTTAVSGYVGGDAKLNDTVTLTVNGHDFTGNVQTLADGQLGYSIAVNTADLANGQQVHASITATDGAGNTIEATADHTVTPDYAAEATITINQIAGDDVINAQESQQPTTAVSGYVGGDAKLNDTVTLTVNGHDFTGTVQPMPNGHLGYSIDVNTADLANGQQVHASITATDGAGNTIEATADHTVTPDYAAEATITIDTIAVDDVINAHESQQPTTAVSGYVGGDAKINDTVTLTVNGHDFTGNVQTLADGHLGYSIDVNTADLANGQQVHASITATDGAGNTIEATADHTVTPDYAAEATITIDTIAVDDVINAQESQQPTTSVTGTVGGDARVHDVVTLTVNGHDFTGTVQPMPNGHLGYSIDVNTADLANGQQVHASITATDGAGNTVEATADHTVTPDYIAEANIAIDDVTSDNILNHTELSHPTQTITGIVGGDAKADDPVHLDFGNGKLFDGKVIDMGNGQFGYRIEVDSSVFGDNEQILFKDVNFTATVTAHDAAKNEVIVTTEHTVHIDNHAYNGLTINTIAGDNIVNLGESQHETLVTGQLSGKDAHPGDKLEVTVQGNTFKGDIYEDAQGHLYYEAKIPTGTLHEGKNDVQVTITSKDKADNETVTTEHTSVTLDTKIAASITTHDVTADNVLNHDELDTPKQLIRGEVADDVHVGDVVRININDHHFSGLVIDLGNGKLGYQIPVDSSAFSNNQGEIDAKVTYTVSVTTRDVAGNETTAETTKTVTIDNHANNGLTIETVAQDDIVNLKESQHDTLITGEATGDAKLHDPVTVTVNNQTFTGEVVSVNGKFRYEVAVAKDALNEGENDVQVSITSHDAAGNVAVATEHHNVIVDTHAYNGLTINTIAGDNIVNLGESQHETLVTGQLSGKDAQPGDKLEVTVQGNTFKGDIYEDAQGHLYYEAKIPTGTLHEGKNDVQVTITSHDKAGNEAVATEQTSVTLDTKIAASITTHDVTADNVLNHDELDTPKQLIRGEVADDVHVGDVVRININDHHFSGQVIDLGNGKLGYQIPVDSSAFSNNQGEIDAKVTYTVSVTTRDVAGNETTAETTKTVTIDNHANNGLTIETVAQDDIVNLKESQQDTLITGEATGDAKLHDPVTVTVNNQTFTGEVVSVNGKFRYEVAVAKDALNEGENDVQVSITSHDAAGNVAVATEHHNVIVDTHAYNGLTIDTVTPDNIVNHAESERNVHITGHVSGKDAQSGDVVDVWVQGQHYDGKVFADSQGHLYYDVSIPRDKLVHGDATAKVTITSHDKAGNEAVATETHDFSVDLHADATITTNDVTTDNKLSHVELETPKQLITGEVGGDARIGDKVSIEINSKHFGGEVIDLGGGKLGYQIPVDSSAFGNNNTHINKDVTYTVSVTSHDAVNNEVTVPTTHTVHVDNFAENKVTITKVAGDNIINMHESRMPTFISGVASGDAKAGDLVEVSVNGQTYKGEVVGTTGHWHYNVPVPSSQFHEGTNNVQVKLTSHDSLGNEAVATEHRTVTVDTHAENTVTINDATSDNILNKTELGNEEQTITGVVGGDAKIGDEVTLEINGNYYRGLVEDMHDGKGTLGYKIPVLSSEFGDNNTILNKDVSVKATLVSHDAAGNEAIAVSEHTIHVDNHAYNGLTINTVAGDNVVNHGESKHETLVTGRVSGKDAHIGDQVEVLIGTKTYPGTIFADPQGHLYYEAKIPTGALKEGKNGVSVTITSHDAAGNEAVSTETTNVTLDTHANATINIHELTAGPVLNYDELATPKQLITGDVGRDAQIGDKVSLEINGKFFGGKVIDLGNGHLGYQIPVDSSAFGNNQQHLDTNVKIIASVTSHDAAGNEVTVKANHTVHLDNHAEAGITISPVTGDGTINAVESGQATTKISGTVNGDVHKGDEVLVVVNHQLYEATVQELPHQNGALGYSVDVATSDLLADPTPDAYIVGYDANGNIQLAHATQNVGIDLLAEATITIDPVTGNKDNMINGEESHNEFTTITGKVDGDVKVGDVVHLEVNGIDMTTQVFKDPHSSQLEYKIDVSTYDLMTDPKITATVTATDNANNVITVDATQDITVDTKVEATISVDSVTNDNVLNGAELKQGYTLVSGKVTGEMNPGDPLTLTVNGHTYNGFVENQGVDAQGNIIMGYHIPVSTADIQANPNIHASIDVTDTAKNHTVATANHHVGKDDHADASVTINIVSGDDVLNANDQQSPTTIINGKVGGDVKAGDTVHLLINGTDHQATVADQGHGLGLGYSIAVNTSDLLADPTIVATVDATDAAGNKASASATHNVGRDDGAQATITIDPVTDDNTINNAEAHNPITPVTGHVIGDVNPGDLVDLNVNGQHYYGTVDKNLGYKIDVSTDDLLSVKNPELHASVTGHDAAGNTVLATADHPVDVDTRAEATITVGTKPVDDHVTPDFYIISGEVGGDAKVGDVVKIHVLGKTYITEVIAYPDGHLGYSTNDPNNNNFSTIYEPLNPYPIYFNKDVVNDKTDIVVDVTSTDSHGNTVTVSAHTHPGVDPSHGGGTVTPPQHTPPDVHITVSPVAGNDVINQQESQSGKTIIRGTVSGDVHVGDTVIVHLANDTHTYTGQVYELPNLPGEYGYVVNDVDTDVLANHPVITATVAAHSDSSVTASTSKTVTFDTDVHATITLDDVAGDNVINIDESNNATTPVSGTVTGDVKEGDNVTLLINGNSITTQVYRDPATGELKFTKDVSTNDLRQDPAIKVSVTGHDDQGNTVTVSDDKTISVDTEIKASVTIDPIGHHNVLNLDDTNQLHTTISGKVDGDVNPGDEVKVTVNGTVYDHIKIDGNHGYSVDVLTSELASGGTITAQVTGHDAAGNTLPASATQNVTVDTTAHATITMNTVSGDNVLSHHDLQSQTTRISGTVGEDARINDDVIITINNHATPVKVVELPHMNGLLGYVADVNTSDLYANPEIHVKVIGTDDVGNSFSAEMSKTVLIDDHADVTMNVNDVSGDNVLNLVESQKGKTTITGTVNGDVHEGDKVTIHVNGNDLPATLHQQADGQFTFSLDVNTSDLLADQKITYTVTGVDQYGNTLTITETNTITIDQIAENQIHIDTVAGDDKVNIVEHSGPSTNISGVVDKDAHAGDTVTLHINGQIYHGTLSDHDGNLTYDIAVKNSDLKEGKNTVDVSVTGQDAAGNEATSTATHDFTLDTQIHGSITIDPVATDNVINGKESRHVEVTGKVDGDAQKGDLVTLEINGHIGHGTVDLVNGELVYNVPVKESWLHEGENKVKVSVDVSDDAGNKLTVDVLHRVVVDSHADASITVDPITADNTINAKESKHISVTGQVEGDAKEGDKVTLEINGHTVSTDVRMIGNHLGYEAHVDKSWMHQGHNDVNVSVSVTDAAGNHLMTPPVVHPVYVDTKIDAVVTINSVTADNVVNDREAENITVNGKVGADVKAGDLVELEVNNHTFTTQVRMINGHLGYEAQMNRAWLNEGDNDLHVKVTTEDHAGNITSAEQTQKFQLDTHADATITIDPVAADNVINAKESQHMIHVTGKVDGDAHDGDLVTLHVNGHTIETKVVPVGDHLGYDVRMDKTWLHEGENNVTVNVRVTDDAGNRVTPAFNQVVVLDTHADASISVNPVAGDNVINASEMKHISLTGQVGGDAKEGDKVTLDINHHTMTTDVKMIDGHLGYDVNISKSWVHEGHNDLKVGVKVTDAAGNTTTAHHKETFQVDTHADATLTVNKIAGDNHISAREAQHDVTHITGQIEGDVHRGDHVTATIGDKHYDAVVHDHKGHLSYDIPVDTADLNIGTNTVNVSVAAHDAHGNNTLIKQAVDVTVDGPFHHGKHDVEVADKSHHAAHAHDHGLSNLFDDGDDSLSFNLHQDAKGHRGDESHKIFGAKEGGEYGKVDLSDLAKELHEGTDITHYIKGGDDHGKADAGTHAAHVPAAAPPAGDASHIALGHDSHGSASYSLDHLIAKPEHYSH
ncbi:Ig-like domain-containing protein [Buttiauxella izardii]|uniref:Ig-like domain-containing protein n=1 Tax=Buttiauxella izardii TaxID=82991 RepID=A0A3A5JZ50_9ENTR|nr:Ig-like domain-containing protein [Buttiauxella izardii]RJT27513.1 Ig-like domain-containing protein [Buttiauxella izardii]